ncbi:hypothetical protein [Arthrobacter sp. HY1533]|uniref:hypothetical protein n=1 Tax=Arthrobacter sp. HY1533 TaxID=2970919 RepID=UPI0022BA0B44|nr:hypothetical protein [Arthrobacter sp. HY1533]
MTKLSGTLPGGDNNGLGSLARALTADPHKTALIVAVVDCKSITIDTDTGDKVATVRIRRVEPIDPQDTEQAQRLLVRGLERRTGAVMLPIDLEDELSKLFANLVDLVDLETGEVLDRQAEDAADDAAEDELALPAEDDSTDEAEKLPEASAAEVAALEALMNEPDPVAPEPAAEEAPAEKPKRVRKSRAKAVADAVAEEEAAPAADDEGLPWLKD